MPAVPPPKLITPSRKNAAKIAGNPMLLIGRASIVGSVIPVPLPCSSPITGLGEVGSGPFGPFAMNLNNVISKFLVGRSELAWPSSRRPKTSVTTILQLPVSYYTMHGVNGRGEIDGGYNGRCKSGTFNYTRESLLQIFCRCRRLLSPALFQVSAVPPGDFHPRVKSARVPGFPETSMTCAHARHFAPISAPPRPVRLADYRPPGLSDRHGRSRLRARRRRHAGQIAPAASAATRRLPTPRRRCTSMARNSRSSRSRSTARRSAPNRYQLPSRRRR